MKSSKELEDKLIVVIWGESLGWMAAICTMVAFVPQVLKIVKTRSVKDISVGMYFIFCLGVFLCIIYGVHLGSIPMILSNIITLSLASAVLIMKILWSK